MNFAGYELAKRAMQAADDPDTAKKKEPEKAIKIAPEIPEVVEVPLTRFPPLQRRPLHPLRLLRLLQLLSLIPIRPPLRPQRQVTFQKRQRLLRWLRLPRRLKRPLQRASWHRQPPPRNLLPPRVSAVFHPLLRSSYR